MIKIEIKNLEKIKDFHKGYFDEFVKVNFEKIIDYNQKEAKAIKFLKDYFYSGIMLKEELMSNLCFGNIEVLQYIIKDFDKEYKKYLNTIDFKSHCLDRIEKYAEYLDTTKMGSGNERFIRWKSCIEECIEILKKDDSDCKYLKENFEDEKREIEEFNKDKKTNIYTNKSKMKEHIKKFINLFDSKTPKDILKEIFNYNKFSNNKNKLKVKDETIVWNRHQLISMMAINVCPYCNRQYISSYVENGRYIKTTADLDHFYSKSEYPILALSLYNFVPSCQICNSRFKIATDFYEDQHVYPYTEEFGENAKFKTTFYTDSDKTRIEIKEVLKKEDKYDISYLLGNSNNFKIELKSKEIDSDEGKKIKNSIETFHLEELYNFHKDYVRELIKKAIIYNDSRIDELYTQYPELFSNREEVLQMVVSNYINDEDLGKRPLAKLTKDICEELGLR